MHKPIKYAEKGVTLLANAGWMVYDRLNQFNQRPSFTPAWADRPLLKSHEKVKPPLGWPRVTDSLCPKCVPEIRQEILDGKKDYKILINEEVGEIKAQIIERAQRVVARLLADPVAQVGVREHPAVAKQLADGVDGGTVGRTEGREQIVLVDVHRLR